MLVGDEKGKAKNVSVKLIRKIRCTRMGMDSSDDETLWSKKVNKEAGESSGVGNRLKDMGKPLAGGYKAHFEETFDVPSTYLPSVKVEDFSCDYEIQVSSQQCD